MKEQLNANRFARGLRNTMHLKRTRKTRQLAPTLVNKQPQAKFKMSEVFLSFRVPLNLTSKSLSSTPKTPQFYHKTPTVPHQKPLSFTTKLPQFHKPHQFHTKNRSVQHQNPLSSTTETRQFNTPQFHTKIPSVPHTYFWEFFGWRA